MTPPRHAAERPPGRFRALRQKRWFRYGVDAAVLVAALLAIGAWQTRGHLDRGAAPELALPSLSGEAVAPASLRGKPTLVAIWAPWCSVCKAASGNLGWVERIAGDRARVVSVAAAFEDEGEVRAYVREQGLSHPVLLADDAAARALRVGAFPTYYFLDEEGRVKGSATGYTTTLGMLARLFL
jgi:thiol-disulfide isomerase/thioredoxin